MTKEMANGLPVKIKQCKGGWRLFWGRTDVGFYQDFLTAAKNAASIYLEDCHEQKQENC